MIIELSVEDIVKHWKVIAHAYAKTAFLIKKNTEAAFLQTTLLELLAGRRSVFALLNENREFKVIFGVKVMTEKNNLEATTSVIVGPVFGFEATNEQEKIEVMDTMRQYRDNVGADALYFYSPIPMAWNVAEKVGMEFVAKVYVDKKPKQGGKRL